MNWFKTIKLSFNRGDPVKFINPLNGQPSSGVFDAIFEEGMNKGKARVRIGNMTGRPVVIPLEQLTPIVEELKPGQIVNLPNYPTESPAKIIEHLGNSIYRIQPKSNREMKLPITEISF